MPIWQYMYIKGIECTSSIIFLAPVRSLQPPHVTLYYVLVLVVTIVVSIVLVLVTILPTPKLFNQSQGQSWEASDMVNRPKTLH